MEDDMLLLWTVAAVMGWRLWTDKEAAAWGAVLVGISKIGWDLRYTGTPTIIPDLGFILLTLISIPIAVAIFALFRWLRIRRDKRTGAAPLAVTGA
jgi:hypothetical protein